MVEDLVHHQHSPDVARALALHGIYESLRIMGKTLEDFGLPVPDPVVLQQGLLHPEGAFGAGDNTYQTIKPVVAAETVIIILKQFNVGQIHVFNANMQALDESDPLLPCCGLRFIPADNQPDKHKVTQAHIRRYVNKINTAIFYEKMRLYNGVPEDPNTLRGHLTKFTETTWRATLQDWEENEDINNGWTTYRNQYSPNGYTTPVAITSAINQLSNDKEIYLSPADKGGGLVLWDRKAYRREAVSQLNDPNTYDPQTEIQVTERLRHLTIATSQIAEKLFEENLISRREKVAIIRSESKACHIYMLLKINKKISTTTRTFPGRPIVSTVDSTINLLDKYITELTASLLSRIPGSGLFRRLCVNGNYLGFDYAG